VLLKGIQGTANAVMTWMKDEAAGSLWSKFLLMFSWPILARIKKRIDYARTGGALLLGVKQPVVIAHGSSKAQAITQAILFAHKTVQQKILPTFNDSLQALLLATKVSLIKDQKKVLSHQSQL
jgi:glycerol-3-phosphate acyltransferase PlsX